MSDHKTVAPLIAAGRQRIAEEVAALQAVGESLDGSFVDAVRLIRESTGKVVTVGVGTSGPVARRLAHLLATTGTPAVYLHPGDALHGGLGAIESRDVVLAISKGGRSAELNDFARLAKARGASLLAVTANAESPLSQLADVAAVLTGTPEADPGGVVAMGSGLVVAAWGDALAIVLMQISGYGWDQVIGAHPSGAVGLRQELPAPLPPLPDPARDGGLT